MSGHLDRLVELVVEIARAERVRLPPWVPVSSPTVGEEERHPTPGPSGMAGEARSGSAEQDSSAGGEVSIPGDGGSSGGRESEEEEEDGGEGGTDVEEGAESGPERRADVVMRSPGQA
jgi:hypothetical protein